MSTLTLPMASPRSLKRTCDEAGLEEPIREHQASIPSSRQASPVPSAGLQKPVSSQPIGDVQPSTSSVPTDSSILATALPNTLPKSKTKKPRLTFEEKEALRIEKEFKDRQKAEDKARKEEEKAKKEAEKEAVERQKAQDKARKEEEKRLKEVEKEEKRKAKEEQARIKLEEKKQKEEESNKKARNQLRMDKFFSRPTPNGTSSESLIRGSQSPLSSRRSSVSEVQALNGHRRSPSVQLTPSKSNKSDYERCFQEFPTKPNTVIAPHNRFSRDERGLEFAQKRIDEVLEATMKPCEVPRKQCLKEQVIDLLHMSASYSPRRPRRFPTIKEIMAAIDGTTSNPIDLTDSQFQRTAQKPLDMLKKVPVKYLKFAEDVRPPYTGTCTRLQDTQEISKLARNPFGRSLPNTDYDYDSEAEWEEPAEGEDLDSEGEEEPEDDDAGDDMDEFLDDEEATEANRAVKRRPLLGDQEPKCTGLCWETSEGHSVDYTIAGLDWRLLKLDILMDNPQLPIDPYCSTYWQPTFSTTAFTQASLMEPPRLPLHPINRQTVVPSTTPLTGVSKYNDASQSMRPAKQQRLIAPELMEEFKAAVQGSDLNKLAIVEILKKQFAKQPKDAIKTTLELIAERVGSKNAEKRWVLKSGF